LLLKVKCLIITEEVLKNNTKKMAIILLTLVVIALWIIILYNGLIKLRNRAEEAWSDIDVQLKRRYDLIPNLVETVKGYAAHEKGLFENVTNARAAALTASQSGDPKEITRAENALSGTLKTLFAVSENYPDLKSSNNFIELQRELRDTEDKIQASRRFYNTNVKDFNTKLQSFPANLIADALGFGKKEFFELDNQEAKEPIKVNF
jgi:LemA protein